MRAWDNAVETNEKEMIISRIGSSKREMGYIYSKNDNSSSNGGAAADGTSS